MLGSTVGASEMLRRHWSCTIRRISGRRISGFKIVSIALRHDFGMENVFRTVHVSRSPNKLICKCLCSKTDWAKMATDTHLYKYIPIHTYTRGGSCTHIPPRGRMLIASGHGCLHTSLRPYYIFFLADLRTYRLTYVPTYIRTFVDTRLPTHPLAYLPA